jgi:predicted phosphohydrolase
MKIQYLSDLHLEFISDDLKINFINLINNCCSDVLVIAGDLDISINIIKTLELLDFLVKKDVIFVPGNHDYWGNQKLLIDEKFKEFNNSSTYVHILNNEFINIDNILFLGSTGWISHPNSVKEVNDYGKIFDIGYGNEVRWALKSYNFFKNVLDKYSDDFKDIICVSHYLPSDKLTHSDYKGSSANPFFVNSFLEYLMQEFNIDWWIFGHTHKTMKEKISNTNCVCNPYGYAGYELNKEFDINKIIEI